MDQGHRRQRAAAPPDPAPTSAKPIRSGRATAARSPTSPGTTTRAARSRSSAPAGGDGRIVTPEPGYYREPAFSPDGRLIAYRKGSDGFLATPLWGRDPGIYVLSLAGRQAEARVEERHLAAVRHRTASASSSSTPDSDDNQLFKSVGVTGADPMHPSQGAPTPRSSRCRRTSSSSAGPSATRPMSCRSCAAAARSTSPPTPRRCRRRKVSADAGDYLHWSGDGSTLYWTQGPGPLRAAASTSPPSTAPRPAPSPPIAHLGFVAAEPHPTGTDRADQRADRHHERRPGDRRRHRAHRRQPHRRGRPGGQRRRPGRHAHHRHDRQDHHARLHRRPLARAARARTRSSPTRTGSITPRSPTA